MTNLHHNGMPNTHHVYCVLTQTRRTGQHKIDLDFFHSSLFFVVIVVQHVI